jgi:hypothetical protein
LLRRCIFCASGFDPLNSHRRTSLCDYSGSSPIARPAQCAELFCSVGPIFSSFTIHRT